MTTQGEFYMIKQNYDKGMSVTDIATITGRDRKTIKKVISIGEHHPYSRQVIESKLDPFKDYILNRMDEGCLNAMIILDEITEQGYTGKITILRDFMRPHRKRCKQLFTELAPCPSCSDVIEQFMKKYPKVTIEVIHNAGERLIN